MFSKLMQVMVGFCLVVFLAACGGGSGGGSNNNGITGDEPDAFEPDNSMGAASLIEFDVPQAHNHFDNDEDFVSFTLAADTTIRLETYDLGSGADTVIELFDEVGNLIAENDDCDDEFNNCEGGLESRIVQTLSAGTYFANISDFDRTDGSLTAKTFRVILTVE